MATASGKRTGKPSDRPFHMRRWLSIQQAVDHLSALSEEPLTSDDLARLAEDHQLDLYWYRPGQQLRYLDQPGKPNIVLKHPLRLSPTHNSDWRAIVGILRQRPALPAEENDTPTLEDTDGNRLRITFDFRNRPEPYSSRWYPNYGELVVRRRDLDRLENELFSAEDEPPLAPDLLLDVIWQLEQLALENGHAPGKATHDAEWLTQELSQRTHMDATVLGRVLHAAERQHQTHT